jgi:hypothetical protein
MAKARTAGKNLQAVPPSSVLRLDHGLARSLDAEAQLQQCVDHLENPEVLSHELIQSFTAIERYFATTGAAAAGSAAGNSDDSDESDVLELEHFYEGREVEIAATSPASGVQIFECVAGSLQPLPRQVEDERFDGIDYVGVLQLRAGRAVLGTVESKADATPYLLLLRALCGLTEMHAALKSGRLPSKSLARALAAEMRFDLHLVVGESIDRNSPLLQLTRDLAESVSRSVKATADHPLPLGEIVCLRMDLSDFSGRLELEWAV